MQCKKVLTALTSNVSPRCTLQTQARHNIKRTKSIMIIINIIIINIIIITGNLFSAFGDSNRFTTWISTYRAQIFIHKSNGI